MKTLYIPERKFTGVVTDFVLSDGGMLDGGKWQDPHESSLVQNFDIGTRLVMGERTFRYCKFYAAAQDIHAVVDRNTDAVDGVYDATNRNVKVGALTVTALDVAERAKNHFKGGWANLFGTGAGSAKLNHDIWRKITYSPAKAAEALSTITVNIDYPITSVCVTGIALTPSNYSKAGAPLASGAETFIGMPCGYSPADSFGWIQTWGPCMGHYNLVYPGGIGAPGDREVYFNASGEIITPKQSGSDVYVSYQRAGYILTTGGGTTFFMLQLSP